MVSTQKGSLRVQGRWLNRACHSVGLRATCSQYLSNPRSSNGALVLESDPPTCLLDLGASLGWHPRPRYSSRRKDGVSSASLTCPRCGWTGFRTKAELQRHLAASCPDGISYPSSLAKGYDADASRSHQTAKCLGLFSIPSQSQRVEIRHSTADSHSSCYSTALPKFLVVHKLELRVRGSRSAQTGSFVGCTESSL